MKKTFLRIIGLALSAATVWGASYTSVYALTEELESGSEVVPEQSEQIDAETVMQHDTEFDAVPYIVGEDTSHRGENEKHFRLSDGSFVMAAYEEPVHYLDAGEWKDIDNTLSLTESGYRNAAGALEVLFDAESDSDGLYTVEYMGHTISFSVVPYEEPDAELIPVPEPPEVAEIMSETQIPIEANASEIQAAETAAEITEPSVPELRSIVPMEPQTYAISDTREGSTVAAVEEYRAANPDASDEDVIRIAEEQNRLNKEQRSRIIGGVCPPSGITYENVFPNTDLEYLLTGSSVKENIIISAPADEYVFNFAVDTELSVALAEDGSVIFSDESGEAVFTMPAPYMTDADGERSYAVSYGITEGGTLTVTADKTWINAEGRAFPVAVDPTVCVTKETSSDQRIITEYVSDSDFTNTHQSDLFWYAGGDIINGSFSNYYSYAKIQQLPALPPSSRIINATINMGLLYFNGIGTTEYNMMVQEALPSWTNQFSSTPTVNSNPVLDYRKVDSTQTITFIGFDITTAVQKWYSGGTNNGLAFYSRLTDGSVMSADKYVYSYFMGYGGTVTSEGRPSFTVTYRNIMGVEGYYTARSMSVGRGGTAYVGDFSGNLVMERPLVTEAGVTLSYVYNSLYGDQIFTSSSTAFNTVDYSNMKSSPGWRLNVQESLVSTTIYTIDGNKEFLIYSDSDGTEHWFPSTDTNIFKDEDGLGLTITRDGTTCTMSDDKNNRKIFRHGYLSEIIDSNDNKTVLLYDTDTYSATTTDWHPKSSTADGKNQLKKLVFVNSWGNLITVATLTYTNGVLTLVEDRSGDDTSLSVADTVNAPRLTAITDSDGYGSGYKYSAYPYRITVVYDNEADQGLEIHYNCESAGNTSDTVNNYSRFTSDALWGSTYTYYSKVDVAYSGRTTVYYDYGSQITISNSFDDIYTTYTFDLYGRTVTVYSEDFTNTVIGVSGGSYTESNGTSSKNNKIVAEGGTGAVSQNLLTNSGFEQNDGWSIPNGLGSGVSAVYNGDHYTGNRSMRISTLGAAEGARSARYQGVSFPSAGTYTLSAKVKINQITPQTNSSEVGVYIGIGDQYGNLLVKSVRYTSPTNDDVDDGWVTLSCSYTVTGSTYLYVYLSIWYANADVLFDNVQLAKEELTSCNLMYNSNFAKGSDYWTLTSGTVVSTEHQNGTTGNVLKFEGDPGSTRNATQTININLPATETYILSGWAKASSVAIDDERGSTFRLGATVTYSDNTTDDFYKDFNYLVVDEWQYLCLPIVPESPTKTVSNITIYINYNHNIGTAYFDDLSLVRELARSYTYDENGNVVAVNKTKTDELVATYATDASGNITGDLTSLEGGAGGTRSYTYDYKHNLTKVSQNGVDLEYSYDGNGNIIMSTLSNSDDTLFMESSAMYTDCGTKISRVNDNLGNEINYSYLPSSDLVNYITTPVSNTSSETLLQTNYAYNSSERISDIWITPSTAFNNKISYSYDKGNLTQILRSATNLSQTQTLTQNYSFTYNDLGQRLTTKVGSQTLASYVYDSLTHNMSSLEYANGDNVSYTYDILDRVKTINYEDANVLLTYAYDGKGNVSSIQGKLQGIMDLGTYVFEYDTLGRLIRCSEVKLGEILQSSENIYDSKGQLTGHKYFDGANTVTQEYVYGSDTETTGLLGTYVIKSDETTTDIRNFYYDELNRLSYSRTTRQSGDFIKKKYTYKSGTESGQTTSLVSSVGYGEGMNSSATDTLFNYSYDNIGNITAENFLYDGVSYGNDTFKYDDKNQLVMETVDDNALGEYTIVYAYDEFGNIVSATKYDGISFSSAQDALNNGTPVSTETYTYGSEEWRDLLTAYNGTAITYDAIGNPLSYYNGQSYTMTWQKGRELASAAVGTKSIEFSYNSSSLRTKKVVSGDYTDTYLYDGSTLVELVRAYTDSTITIRLVFTYDESGLPYALDYYGGDSGNSGTRYYYITNLQGDVVQLVDGNNACVARYAYDAWGKLLGIYNGSDSPVTAVAHIGILNPLRYRGYFYDSETGFYYCGSRYYDPQIRRFINAEGNISDSGDGFLRYNLFAYSLNNPISYNAKQTSAIAEAVSQSSGAGNFSIPELGAISGFVYTGPIRYDVPLYNQTKYSLCWAFCQVMVEDYQKGIVRSNDEATEAAIMLAVKVHNGNIEIEDTWNYGEWPEICLRPSTNMATLTIEDLYNDLRHGPLYAHYSGDISHLVVVTGIDYENNIIYTNNPWGENGEQTFEEFLKGFAGLSKGVNVYLCQYYYVS